MTSWDDLDSFKLTLQPTFQAPSRPNPAWQGGFQHTHQTFTPPTQSTLSLDRYLQLLQLLCGNQPTTAAAGDAAPANTWTVRQLGELERSAAKMEDLRKVLALNGRTISAKNKQDMLNKIVGLQLACPGFFSSLLLAPPPASANKHESAHILKATKKQELQHSMQRALQWADLSSSETTLATAAVSRQGYFSFCPLPEITLPSSLNPFSEDHAPEIERFHHQQPATSVTTFASRPALHHADIAESILPSTSNTPKAPGFLVEKDTIMHDAVHQTYQNYQYTSRSSPDCSPKWLISGYNKVAAICQGIKNLSTSHDAAPLSHDLKGRKIAFVLVEDFQQGGELPEESGGDNGNFTSTTTATTKNKNKNDDGIIDKVARGIHLGQVVEWIGHQHDSDLCPDGCTQHHNFCFVRVTPTETTAPEAKRRRRRLDLEMDLREECRLETLEDLLLVGEQELADAWVLVEPKDL
jgi:hypothetical protein